MPRTSTKRMAARLLTLLVCCGGAGAFGSQVARGDGDTARAAKPAAGLAGDDKAAPRSREFRFTFDVKVTGLEPGGAARIWLPVPPSNEDQEARLVKQSLPRETEEEIGTEPKYGNQILYIASRAGADGTIPLSVTYQVTRREVKADAKNIEVARQEVDLFLRPDAKVPVGGKSLVLLDGKSLPKDQLRLGRLLYDVVNEHMTYSKQGTGWGNGDSEWACDSRYGNCSDFHSLFISLARSQKMPAKFEMGFPLPPERGRGEIPGYHCWAKFKPTGRGWIPVDISEANKVKAKNPAMADYYFGNLTEDRVAFSVGRDLTLVPKQDGPPLNFLVYPYVEVGGRPYASEKVERKFSFEDVNAAGK